MGRWLPRAALDDSRENRALTGGYISIKNACLLKSLSLKSDELIVTIKKTVKKTDL